MTAHPMITDELREQAWAFAVGSLSELEAQAYRRHLGVCGVCRSEERSARALAADLALSAPSIAPAASIREKLMSRIASSQARPDAADAEPAPVQTWKSWAAGGATLPFSYAYAADAVWEPTGVDGVKVRRLFVDAENDRVAMLIRMAPGTSYPGHMHGGPEDCYVIEGDLYAHDFTMKAGDYRRASRGATDPVQSTVGGCLLFIVSSLHDELEAGPA